MSRSLREVLVIKDFRTPQRQTEIRGFYVRRHHRRGGPTGLMLAGELRLHRCVLVLERRGAAGAGPRPGRTCTSWMDQRGLPGWFWPGQAVPAACGFAGIDKPPPPGFTPPTDILAFRTHTEALLVEWAAEIGAEGPTRRRGVARVRTTPGERRVGGRYPVSRRATRSVVTVAAARCANVRRRIPG